jgi:hypothetical protein
MGNTYEKKHARALQKRTGWSYCEALRCVRTMTPEAIEALIVIRDKGMKAIRNVIVKEGVK